MKTLTLPLLPAQEPGRQCGPCSLCCTLLPVIELQKNAGVTCSHVREGGGCDIHAIRPPVCRSFECAWLLGAGVEEDRPDLTGLFVCGEERYRERLGTVCYASPRLDIHGSLFRRLERMAAYSRRPVFIFVPPTAADPVGVVITLEQGGQRSAEVLPREAFAWGNSRAPGEVAP